MYLCTMCTMLYNKANENNLTNPVTNNRVAIWEINPSLYRGKQSTCAQIEHIWTKPTMSLELWSLTQSYLDLTVYSVAYRIIYSSSLMYGPVERKATDVSPRGFTGFSMFAKFLYCLIYNYKNHIDLSMIFYHCMERAYPASSRSYCIYTGIPLRNLCTCLRRIALGYLGLRLKDSYLG